MKQGTNTLVLIVAILAFVPVLAVNFIVDSYVRNRGAHDLQKALNAISADSQASIYDGLSAVSHVISNAPSLCTPTFLTETHKFMLHSAYVRQVTVENRDGALFCDAFDSDFSYVRRSNDINIAGRAELVAAVETVGETETILFRVSRTIANGKVIAAFVLFPQLANAGQFPDILKSAAYMQVSLVDGTELFSQGDPSDIDDLSIRSLFVVANAFAGDLPVRVEAAVPFPVIQAMFVELYFFATVLASAISASLLLLVLQAVRRGKVPDFDLERAIVHGEIKPYYQPVVDITTGRVVGCEVLARWVKPNGKIISPAAFIEYAELTGLAIPMTLQIMEQVREELSDLSRLHPDMKISINLFEGHFRDTNIIEDVKVIFGGSAIRFSQLVFEITERYPLDDAVSAMTVIDGLRSLGARMAMDDLGTGHSNLAYLQKLGLDIVKIDRVFVEMIDGNEESAPVLEGLIKMGQELGADMIAEGVQTEAQARFLRERGVVQVQGFMFAPALPLAKYTEMVDALNGDSADSASARNALAMGHAA